MKNRDSRKEVENLLQWVFNVDDGKVLDTLAIKANEYNIAPSKVNRIWQSILSLESLTVDELCVFYSILCKFYKQKMPEPTEFFTPTEIVDIEKLKHLQKGKKDETIVIENAFRLKENEWNTTMPMSLIVKIDNSNKLRYNRETQRPTILKMLGDGVDERNFLNKRQVREIAEKISTGEYHPDAITLNVLDDGNNSVTYNEMTHELYINGMIDIPDGYH